MKLYKLLNKLKADYQYYYIYVQFKYENLNYSVDIDLNSNYDDLLKFDLLECEVLEYILGSSDSKTYVNIRIFNEKEYTE